MEKLVFLAFFALTLLGCTPKGSPEEEIAWKKALESNTITALDSFLIAFPESKHKNEIAAKRDGILYQNAVAENTVYHLKYYLKEFPQGKYKKEITGKLENLKVDAINFDDLDQKTFIGSMKYFDRKDATLDILTIKFSAAADLGNTIEYKAAVNLTSNLKKDLKAIVQKNNLSIKFVESTEDEFLLEIPEGRIYVKNKEIIIESTDVSAPAYWIIK